jgi:hypothetical protein
MAAGATYEPIATANGTGSSTTITFASIPQTYTDLVIVASNIDVQIDDMGARLNQDSGSNYSRTRLVGDSSGANSYRNSNLSKVFFGYKDGTASTQTYGILNLMNYSNSTTYKTGIARYVTHSSGYGIMAEVYLWRSTAAITRIDIDSGNANFSTNCKFTLYGIAAA